MRIIRALPSLTVIVAVACSSPAAPLSAVTSDAARADYAVFAQRCSKCHSLSRPLDSGIDDDEYWARYVERMRRMPSSGITRQDTFPILRFLHRYSLEQAAKKNGGVKPAQDGGL